MALSREFFQALWFSFINVLRRKLEEVRKKEVRGRRDEEALGEVEEVEEEEEKGVDEEPMATVDWAEAEVLAKEMEGMVEYPVEEGTTN